MGKDYDSEIADHSRGMISELLEKCTPEQVFLFNRMYGSIDELKLKDMKIAYNQCKRTADKNAKA